jgi:ornithine decarboxylase
MFVQNSSAKKNFEILNRDETIDSVMETIASSSGQDQPFFVFNVDDLFLKYAQWTEHMPRVRPFYSVRCNDDENVLQVLALLGAGFNCGSEREIRQVLSLGVEADDVIFGQLHKILSHLRFAARKDVRRMVFDCEDELQKIQENYPSTRFLSIMQDLSFSTQLNCCCFQFDPEYKYGGL